MTCKQETSPKDTYCWADQPVFAWADVRAAAEFRVGAGATNYGVNVTSMMNMLRSNDSGRCDYQRSMWAYWVIGLRSGPALLGTALRASISV